MTGTRANVANPGPSRTGRKASVAGPRLPALEGLGTSWPASVLFALPEPDRVVGIAVVYAHKPHQDRLGGGGGLDVRRG